MARGVGFVLATALLWSTSGIFIKGIDRPWVTIAFYRALVAGSVLLPMAIWQLRRGGWGRGPGDVRRWVVWLVTMSLTFSVTVSFFVLATKLTTSANAIILEYTSPVWAFLFSAVLLRTPIRRYEWASLGIAMAGVGVLLAGAAGAPSGKAPGAGQYHHLAGCLVALGVGVVFGLMMVAIRRLRGIPTAVATSMNNLTCAALLLPVLLLWPADVQGPATSASGEQFFWLVMMGVFNIAVAYLFFTAGLRHVEATTASLVLLINPVINPIWVLALGEVPSLTTIAGGAIILAALAWLLICKRRDVRVTPSAA